MRVRLSISANLLDATLMATSVRVETISAAALNSGAVSSGSNGILEVDLYPGGSNLMPPGNRGTVDIGTSNNGTTLVDLNNYNFRGDVGVGLRFDVPQLGLHTLRLDFAKGNMGTHTSFGIGQSF